MLDVGCGWGSFAVHAAEHYGVHVTGITLSEPQAAGRPQARARRPGVADRCEFRVMDYRELPGEQFDAIASIGMVEHVGAVNIDAYSATLARLLKPGGRLLNHGIARLRHGEAGGGRVLRALRVPRRRAAAPLARPVVAGEERVRDPPRRGLPDGLRADAARVAAAARGQPRRGGAARRRRSGCASGRSTCAPRGAASRRASPPSTRCSPTGPSRVGARRPPRDAPGGPPRRARARARGGHGDGAGRRRGQELRRPAFMLDGRPLIGLRSAKRHLQRLPVQPARARDGRGPARRVRPREGHVRFTPERPLPDDVLADLLRARARGDPGG